MLYYLTITYSKIKMKIGWENNSSKLEYCSGQEQEFIAEELAVCKCQ